MLLELTREQLDAMRSPFYKDIEHVHDMLALGSDSNAYDVVAQMAGVQSEGEQVEIAETSVFIARVYTENGMKNHVLSIPSRGVCTAKLSGKAYQEAVAQLYQDNIASIVCIPSNMLSADQRKKMGLTPGLFLKSA